MLCLRRRLKLPKHLGDLQERIESIDFEGRTFLNKYIGKVKLDGAKIISVEEVFCDLVDHNLLKINVEQVPYDIYVSRKPNFKVGDMVNNLKADVYLGNSGAYSTIDDKPYLWA